MAAENICEDILSNIRSSCLNFLLTETPFSVTIKIKKSFTRSKDDLHNFPNSIIRHLLFFQLSKAACRQVHPQLSHQAAELQEASFWAKEMFEHIPLGQEHQVTRYAKSKKKIQ